MFWKAEQQLPWYERFAINIAKCGPIPQHLAFIMDGNRRYAKQHNIKKALGHSKGFEKLSETLHWCHELGIREVTVYAFSIENFNRSEEEVDSLIKLAKSKLSNLLKEREKLNKNGVCIRFIGNFELIPADLRKIMSELMYITKDHDKSTLNIAFAYTSRDEITNSANIVRQGIEDGKIDAEDVDEYVLTKCMYSGASRPLDMLLRTSGEVRLSDFMLWQSWNSEIYFAKVLWPDFQLWHLLGAVFHFQRFFHEIIERRQRSTMHNDGCSTRVVNFLNEVSEKRTELLKVYMAS